jgi:adenylate kinase family enzyme
LTAVDALPRRPQRILVAGTSASGKTTLAARIGERLGVRHVEIDALFHGPGWTPRETFVAEVDDFIAARAGSRSGNTAPCASDWPSGRT